jgi:phosphatidate phosphatase APP1
VRGWRSFFTAPVAGAWVEVTVEDEDEDEGAGGGAGARRAGGKVHRVHTDRGGYLDHRLAIDLPPGLHHLTLRTQDGRTARAPVHVVGPDSRVGLVSDIDDTVMVTRLPRPLVAAWNVLVRDENAREPVPGMAELYRALCRTDPELPVMYLSTGAWNAAPAIGRFLHRNSYPTGTLLMTDWGPTNTGWFRSGPRHKVTQLRRLFAELPNVRWVLVGDDGQRDPEIYAGAVRRHPDHVRAVLIRQLTFAEHVLAHGSPVPTVESTQAERSTAATRVPVLQGEDGRSLLVQARRAGLIRG